MGDSNREPKTTLFSKTPNTEYCMSRAEAKPKSFETLEQAKPRAPLFVTASARS
jgi:hypothetical protein